MEVVLFLFFGLFILFLLAIAFDPAKVILKYTLYLVCILCVLGIIIKLVSVWPILSCLYI